MRRFSPNSVRVFPTKKEVIDESLSNQLHRDFPGLPRANKASHESLKSISPHETRPLRRVMKYPESLGSQQSFIKAKVAQPATASLINEYLHVCNLNRFSLELPTPSVSVHHPAKFNSLRLQLFRCTGGTLFSNFRCKRAKTESLLLLSTRNAKRSLKSSRYNFPFKFLFLLRARGFRKFTLPST